MKRKYTIRKEIYTFFVLFRSKKSPLIWFLYLLFVQTYTDPINKNETLKNLYFMGIRDCPWSKGN